MPAKKLMRAVQYDGYGGGAAALKVNPECRSEVKKDVGFGAVTGGCRLENLRRVGRVRVFENIRRRTGKLYSSSVKFLISLLRLFVNMFFVGPAMDVTGEVIEVGTGVKNLKAGDKVVTTLGPHAAGGLAEYVVAKESLTAARPPEVSAAAAAGLPVAGLTAHQALTDSAGIKLDGSGKQVNVLVTAASGGVGHYAVQLAKLGNTHVTATCGARNLDFVKRLGADEVLDYKTPDGAALKSPSGIKYDFVIHCASGIPWSTFEPNLSEKGKVIDITPTSRALLACAAKMLTLSKKQLVPLLLIPKREKLNFLVNLVKEGKLKTVIDSKHLLSEAEDAWAKIIEGHATGKIIVEP
ncbi:hypothetical protein SLEP1_g42456 [Rubroshorea leprosula]|uniref:Enoyl reductase (ER) domain-containing protein n=1 Tax=Rubroshorea leprosula TaxID=152421 RepID=A0AAV5LAT0_9ROSI|nr:hypothetical protein SLEP1_g42456 [Rubroshorea leprosula]